MPPCIRRCGSWKLRSLMLPTWKRFRSSRPSNRRCGFHLRVLAYAIGLLAVGHVAGHVEVVLQFGHQVVGVVGDAHPLGAEHREKGQRLSLAHEASFHGVGFARSPQRSAFSVQRSAFSSNCVAAGPADFDRHASSPVQRNRMAKSWRNACTTTEDRIADFLSPCEENRTSSCGLSAMTIPRRFLLRRAAPRPARPTAVSPRRRRNNGIRSESGAASRIRSTRFECALTTVAQGAHPGGPRTAVPFHDFGSNPARNCRFAVRVSSTASQTRFESLRATLPRFRVWSNEFPLPAGSFRVRDQYRGRYRHRGPLSVSGSQSVSQSQSLSGSLSQSQSLSRAGSRSADSSGTSDPAYRYRDRYRNRNRYRGRVRDRRIRLERLTQLIGIGIAIAIAIRYRGRVRDPRIGCREPWRRSRRRPRLR